jgi:hypothetical protein
VLSLLDTKFPVWFPYCGSWLIALTAEIVLAALPSSLHAPKLQFEYIQLTVQVSRVCLLLLLIVVFFSTRKEGNRRDSGSDEESQALLANGHAVEPGKPQSGNSYGSVPSSNGANTPETGEESGDDPDRERKKQMRKLQERLVSDGNWWTYAKSFSVSHSLAIPAQLIHSTVICHYSFTMSPPLIENELTPTDLHTVCMAFGKQEPSIEFDTGWLMPYCWPLPERARPTTARSCYGCPEHRGR